MKADCFRVLIDAGALMLELDNEQVATLWLEVDSELEGVLYFNKSNELTVKLKGSSHKNQDVALELTPYQGSLEKIGVFLDDQHTRGTDLKFPKEWKAVVTIGAGMKKDKLTQACMRMRKLGFGQSVTFYLSQEVFDKINKMIGPSRLTDDGITAQHVLQWVKENLKQFNENGLVYWATGGKNYAQRLAAEDFFSISNANPIEMGRSSEHLNANAKILANQCMDGEVTTLMSMYGQDISLDKLACVVRSWFKQCLVKLERISNDTELPDCILAEFMNIRDGITERCQLCVPDKLHVVSGDSMEDEQEKELELEKETEEEEERIVERPGKYDPAIPNLHPNVRLIVQTGKKINVMEGIQKLPEIFAKTSFWAIVQPEAWEQHIFASTDFISVLKDPYNCTDSFLRPIEYFATIRVKDWNGSESIQILLLSSYEVNELIDVFREKECPTSLHMFSMRRSEKQALLWNNPRLSLPSGPVFRFPFEVMLGKLPSLLLASGNLYFENLEEQRSFAALLSLALKPWTEEEEVACEKKLITKSGFMVSGYEGRRDYGREGVKGFSRDPTELVRKILGCRHSSVSEISHILRILNEKKCIDLK